MLPISYFSVCLMALRSVSSKRAATRDSVLFVRVAIISTCMKRSFLVLWHHIRHAYVCIHVAPYHNNVHVIKVSPRKKSRAPFLQAAQPHLRPHPQPLPPSRLLPCKLSSFCVASLCCRLKLCLRTLSLRRHTQGTSFLVSLRNKPRTCIFAFPLLAVTDCMRRTISHLPVFACMRRTISHLPVFACHFVHRCTSGRSKVMLELRLYY